MQDRSSSGPTKEQEEWAEYWDDADETELAASFRAGKAWQFDDDGFHAEGQHAQVVRETLALAGLNGDARDRWIDSALVILVKTSDRTIAVRKPMGEDRPAEAQLDAIFLAVDTLLASRGLKLVMLYDLPCVLAVFEATELDQLETRFENAEIELETVFEGRDPVLVEPSEVAGVFDP